MRPDHWLFIVSIGLFVGGIALVIAAERAAQRAAPSTVAAPAAGTPVASVRQIMNGTLAPAAKAVFASVGTIISGAGIEERQPRTDEEWEAVENSAATLSEGGNLLLMGRRAVDKENWAKISQDLIDAGQVAMKAAQAKDPEALLAYRLHHRLLGRVQGVREHGRFQVVLRRGAEQPARRARRRPDARGVRSPRRVRRRSARHRQDVRAARTRRDRAADRSLGRRVRIEIGRRQTHGPGPGARVSGRNGGVQRGAA